MENKNIDGKTVSQILYQELRKYTETKSKKPTIVDISIGEDFGGLVYAKMKKQTLEREVNFDFINKHFKTITKDNLIAYINELNANSSIDGIMIQLPLPADLEKYEREILDTIDYKKDIDGLTTTTLGKLFTNQSCLAPCTPSGIINLLKIYNVDLIGKNVVIINRSNIVGKPLEQLFLLENATTTLCHSKTKELKDITSKADILVVAMNKQEYITDEYIAPGAIVVDIGVHKNHDGKIVGDVSYSSVYDKISLITPPTGSVGPMTIAMLAYNAAKSLYGEEINDVLERGIEKSKKIIRTGK